MTDPNATYKRAYQSLREELGRDPTIRDKGWWEISEQYRRSWTAAVETLVAPQARADRFSRELAPQARSYTREDWQLCPECGFKRDARTGRHFQASPTTLDCERLYPLGQLTNPGAAKNGELAPTGPLPSRVYSRPAQPVQEGTRGPGGGVVAVCVQCGQEWERERRRGRPAYKCLGCR